MENVVLYIMQEWGLLGIMTVGLVYIIYDNWKNNRRRQDDSKELKTDIKNHVTEQIQIVDKKIDIVDHKVDGVESTLNDRIDILSKRIDSLPEDSVAATLHQRNIDNDTHIKQIQDVMLLGEDLYKTMKSHISLINADHLFIGSFHNGNSNLSGIPFCKFDIISECFSDNMVAHDHEFAPVYKDSDILRYGSLFSVIFQNQMMKFTVDPDGENTLSKYEDIIWRRMYGLGIKQMAVCILKDPDNIPSGFLGVVRYDMEEIDMNALRLCSKELERIYSVNKYNMQDAD